MRWVVVSTYDDRAPEVFGPYDSVQAASDALWRLSRRVRAGTAAVDPHWQAGAVRLLQTI